MNRGVFTEFALGKSTCQPARCFVGLYPVASPHMVTMVCAPRRVSVTPLLKTQRGWVWHPLRGRRRWVSVHLAGQLSSGSNKKGGTSVSQKVAEYENEYVGEDLTKPTSL